MKQLLSFFVFLLLLTSSLLAGNGGSGYSRYGIGDIRYTLSDKAIGMGNAGLAAYSGASIDRVNPALWSNITRTRFTLGAQFAGYNTSDDSSSAFLSGTTFDGILLAFPVYTPSGIVLGMGLNPYSTVNYNILSTGFMDGVQYKANYEGEGGVSEAQLGASFTPNSELSLGAKFSYYFGTIRHSITQQFSISDYSDAEEIRSVQTHGAGFTLGAVYSGLGNYLGIDTSRELSLALFLASSSNATTNEEHYMTYTATNQSLTTRDTTYETRGSITIPLRLGIGVAFRTPEFLVASDFVTQQWSDFRGVGALTGTFRDSYRFSIGGELFPRREATATFFQRWAYRVGFFYDASYYTIKNESIDEIGFAGGFGIPVIGDTRLNISGEYSFRGTTNNGLQKDKIMRLSFSISGSERWFVPIEED